MSFEQIVVWIVLGLVAGILAKWIMPGKDKGGFVLTTILGIAGAFVGGWVGSLLGIGGAIGGLSIASIATAVAGALIILFIYRKLA